MAIWQQVYSAVLAILIFLSVGFATGAIVEHIKQAFNRRGLRK